MNETGQPQYHLITGAPHLSLQSDFEPEPEHLTCGLWSESSAFDAAVTEQFEARYRDELELLYFYPNFSRLLRTKAGAAQLVDKFRSMHRSRFEFVVDVLRMLGSELE